jgi:hypothetical protein
MNTRNRTLQQFVATLFVAIGLAVAWGVVIGWGISTTEGLFRSDDLVRESLVVKPDGTPLIESRSVTHYEDVTYRTLDGQPVTAERQFWRSPATLPAAEAPRRFTDPPIGWGQVMSASDYGRPPISWYLIRDNQPLGHGYFVGYDEYSKGLVGYIGRDGFRRALPTEKERFDFGLFQLKWGTGVVTSSSTSLNFGSRPNNYQVMTEGMRLPMWCVFLIDGKQLLEIDFRNRSVRRLLEAPEMVSIGETRDIESYPPDSSTPDEHGFKPVDLMVVRTNDRLIVLDQPAGTKREFVLPEELRSQQLTVYSLSDEELFIEWRKPWRMHDDRTHLAWLKPDGTMARQADVTLADARGPNERLQEWLATLIAPIPAGWITVLGILAPCESLQDNRAETYVGALSQILSDMWPPLLLVALIGGILSWWTWRLQRKFCRSASAAWCAFALLLGVPGFLAYWFEHRGAKLEACGECGQIVPRDRESCAVCNSPFSAPPLMGTEIFA